MVHTSDEELIERAKSVLKPRRIKHGCMVGEVGCALETDKGSVYLGVFIDTVSGMGFCAEHSAIASMITNGEHRIKKIVAVIGNGTALPPCGRCREFMRQISEENMNTEVVVERNKSVKLKDLIPLPWDARG